jgi:hypothetical protein
VLLFTFVLMGCVLSGDPACAYGLSRDWSKVWRELQRRYHPDRE